MSAIVQSLWCQTSGCDLRSSVRKIVERCVELISTGTGYCDVTDMYIGTYSANDILKETTMDLVRPGVIDWWRQVRAIQNIPVSDAALDLLFPIECATNFRRYRGGFVLVSDKRLCLERTYVCDLDFSTAAPRCDALALDFFYNVLFLRLKTPMEIEVFLRRRSDGFLLEEDEVIVLLELGKREVYADTELCDTKEALRDIYTLVSRMSDSSTTYLDIGDFE